MAVCGRKPLTSTGRDRSAFSKTTLSTEATAGGPETAKTTSTDLSFAFPIGIFEDCI